MESWLRLGVSWNPVEESVFLSTTNSRTQTSLTFRLALQFRSTQVPYSPIQGPGHPLTVVISSTKEVLSSFNTQDQAPDDPSVQHRQWPPRDFYRNITPIQTSDLKVVYTVFYRILSNVFWLYNQIMTSPEQWTTTFINNCFCWFSRQQILFICQHSRELPLLGTESCKVLRGEMLFIMMNNR